jgi:hypothetical protein
MTRAFVQEMGWRRTCLGDALYVRIRTENYDLLSWSEVWATFADAYPGCWAVQAFPPADRVMDEQNIYHLFVLDSEPAGLDIDRR